MFVKATSASRKVIYICSNCNSDLLIKDKETKKIYCLDCKKFVQLNLWRRLTCNACGHTGVTSYKKEKEEKHDFNGIKFINITVYEINKCEGCGIKQKNITASRRLE